MCLSRVQQRVPRCQHTRQAPAKKQPNSSGLDSARCGRLCRKIGLTHHREGRPSLLPQSLPQHRNFDDVERREVRILIVVTTYGASIAQRSGSFWRIIAAVVGRHRTLV